MVNALCRPSFTCQLSPLCISPESPPFHLPHHPSLNSLHQPTKTPKPLLYFLLLNQFFFLCILFGLYILVSLQSLFRTPTAYTTPFSRAGTDINQAYCSTYIPPPRTPTTTMADHQDDLAASKTEGFKLGEKKTIEEYKQLGMSFSFSLSLSLSILCCISRWPMAPTTPRTPLT